MKKLTEESSRVRRKAVQSLAQVANRLCAGKTQEEPGEAKRPPAQRAEKRRRDRLFSILGLLGLLGS